MAVDADGEILARGNVIMDGYWEQPDQTADGDPTTGGSTPATAA